ncbi:MAG: FAD-dependent oxidoreductase [Candidatus Devosia phytovorans]|uniref:FAD-dependent oxidoreductase n=1 Tax=Candidatus Devosia phytovorans TaxID=3121372 RepID=A0AAJ5VSV2_9HYPH|nr:FAD-dependent oxidoreductase [Devosia sp.]WEK03672.1 MAG: FAD-dependent oxidoreductase [Devosia sp.]
MAEILKPDLCVIGAGALGTRLAILARQRGLEVTLLPRPRDEANDPTAGALRRAAFIASANRAHAIRTAGTLGMNNADPKPNFRSIGERATAIADAVAPRDTDERLTALGITLLSDEASFTDPKTLRCGETTVRARHFVLATGATPSIPALPGLDQVKYFTPETIADNLRKLSHLVVIGGTPVAFELAQAYQRLGSMVTLVPQGGLLPGFDPELVAVLLRHLREEGLTVLDDAEVTAIQPRSQGTGVSLIRAGSEEKLDVSHILVAMGNEPDLDASVLDAAKLRRDRKDTGALLLGVEGQSSSKVLSAIGGAAGEDAPHLGLRQAQLLLDRLTGQGHGRLDPFQVSRLVNTSPPLAQLGLLPRDEKLRPGQTVLRANLAETDAGRAISATGVVRAVVDARGSVASFGAVGSGAGELASLLALVGPRLPDLKNLALPPASLAAALVDLAEQFAATQPQAKTLSLLKKFRG